MLIISQSTNAVLNVPVTVNNMPVNLSAATDIVVRFVGIGLNGIPVSAPVSYSLNPIPTYGTLTVNANNVSVDIVLESFETAQFPPGTYSACIIVKTPDAIYSTAEKRSEYRTPNILRINEGCNTTDLMP